MSAVPPPPIEPVLYPLCMSGARRPSAKEEEGGDVEPPRRGDAADPARDREPDADAEREPKLEAGDIGSAPTEAPLLIGGATAGGEDGVLGAR